LISCQQLIEPKRDHKVYLVVDGFGHNGGASFRERDVETTVTDRMSEQYAPVRVVAVNPAKHNIEVASEDIAL
jgi:hypothetical protein